MNAQSAILREDAQGGGARVRGGAGCRAAGASRSFLEEQGIRPGAWPGVVTTAGDSVLVRVGQGRISPARALADAVDADFSGQGSIAPDHLLALGMK